MRRLLSSLTVLLLIFSYQLAVQAQTTGSIAGTVTDQNGAVVPNATVEIKGQGGQDLTATTSDNGTYRVPAVQNGVYTVTVSVTGFKKSITNNVKVDVGTPSTVNAVLELGSVEQVVEVNAGGEVLQTQTATVGRTVTGRQITETPIASRDAMDLVNLMPGTASVGAPRRSSINGLPKSAIAITIDGVDVQANDARSSDGYFTYVRPRIDAIDEVTVSTANPGAESSGDGAVQIKFVTKRGTNNYNGGVFWQHRNTALNAAYWYNNRDFIRNPVTGFEPDRRNKIRLNQYGGRYGGPLPFPHFGEGGPFWNSGKDKAFFFFNYEEFRQPESQSRTRTVPTAAAQTGNFSYITGGVTNTVNVLTIAAARNTATGGSQPTTIDPTIASVLARVQSAIGTTGSLTPVTNSPNQLNYNFTPVGGQVRKFLALRFDFNITKNNSFEFITNRQKFVPSKDFLNTQDEVYPGFPAYTQGSNRNSYSTALRSTFGSSLVNEFRYAMASGQSIFSDGISLADFGYLGGYSLGTGGVFLTSPVSRNSLIITSNPTADYTDTINWTLGTHNVSFGGQYKRIKLNDTRTNRVAPSVTFGLDATDPAFNYFSTTTLPGATATQLTDARNYYANLVGRVLTYATTAYLTADGTYQINAPQAKQAHQDTYGLFAQDSWRFRPNLTINYGLRWQPQTAYIVDTANYSQLEDYRQIYGISGFGNIFRPGTLSGTAPRVVGLKPGDSTSDDDLMNFAPSFGAVWSPDFGEKGLFRTILGASGKSVFRGGYSVGFAREGTSLIGSIIGANPGGNLNAGRSLALGGFTVGTNLRDAGNPNLSPNLTSVPATATYPFVLQNAQNNANAFDFNLKTGTIHSFSFGYQRELDKNTVVEFRYVGNRGVDLQRQHDLNEFNTIENGFIKEFRAAQNNLYLNEAAFAAGDVTRRFCPGVTVGTACQTSATNTTAVTRLPTFAYYGGTTGTSQLPISLAYFFGAAAGTASLTPGSVGTEGTVTNTGGGTLANYNSSLFTNTTLLAALSRNAPSITAFGSGTGYELSLARRANAVAAGLPVNFFYVNPATATAASTGAFYVDNSAKTWYDSGVIEVRRRLSAGLRMQASYVWSKAQSNSFASNNDAFASFTHRENGLDLAKNVQVFDIRHQFKIDATYDLPFGKGRMFFGNAGGFVNQLVGGFTVLPTVRWQSGSPFQFGNVQLVGMTIKELQKEIKVRKLANVVTFLPDDIILNTQKAFDININNASGYGTTYGGGGAPSGRFLAPAGYGNCVQRYTGECGFRNLIVYGPTFFKFDVTVAKKFIVSEKRNIELRATFLDALNHPNFRVGGWGADVVTAGVGGATFGQLASGSAYQDVSTTNDPGGRLIDLMLRINF